jgi:hypothetical protein
MACVSPPLQPLRGTACLLLLAAVPFVAGALVAGLILRALAQNSLGDCSAATLRPCMSAGPYKLSNPSADHFQRGQLDVFQVCNAPDVGQLKQIEVRHDGQGKKNGWHLAWVKVTNETTGAVAMFNCNRQDCLEPFLGLGRSVVMQCRIERALGASQSWQTLLLCCR